MNKVYEKSINGIINVVDRLSEIVMSFYSRSSDKIKYLGHSRFKSPSEVLYAKNIFEMNAIAGLQRTRNRLMGILMGDQL